MATARGKISAVVADGCRNNTGGERRRLSLVSFRFCRFVSFLAFHCSVYNMEHKGPEKISCASCYVPMLTNEAQEIVILHSRCHRSLDKPNIN